MTATDMTRGPSNGMRVLMITGDRNLLMEGSGAHERLALQRSAVGSLDAVYFGRGVLFDALKVKGPYDVVTAQDPLWRGLVALYVASRLKAKLNIQVHMDLSSLSLVRHVLAQIVLRHADTVRVVSEKVRKQVEHMSVRGKVVTLPVFVDVERFKALVRQPHEGKRILWVGRFEEEKNPLAAVEVLKEVLERVPDARLTMLGTGSLAPRLAAEAVGLPIELRGWQDPAPYLAEADVVLSTSRHESWGSSIVEALAAGVPVVAPDVGIAREAGALVVPREKLAEAVVDVLRSGAKGVLALDLLPAGEWAVQWRNSLL